MSIGMHMVCVFILFLFSVVPDMLFTFSNQLMPSPYMWITTSDAVSLWQTMTLSTMVTAAVTVGSGVSSVCIWR